MWEDLEVHDISFSCSKYVWLQQLILGGSNTRQRVFHNKEIQCLYYKITIWMIKLEDEMTAM
jgi:hypothetical protein